MERAPRWIDQYQVFEELGRGGFGVVYLARHPNLDRPVALKLLLEAGDANPAMLERFRREAQAAASIRHPGMVQIHDLGTHQDKPYYVMEYVKGVNLKQRIEREGPLDLDEAVAIAVELTEIVAAAHAENILHRDLKPENVIDVEGEDRLKLADFGLARELGDNREQLTRTGAMMGTPGYMSPEQAAGERDRVDKRTDVYGIGATLFALLTGRAPFRGDSPIQTVAKLLREEAPPPSRFRKEIPAGLDAICARALASNPVVRYETVQAFRRDLENYQRGGSVEKTSQRLVRTVKASRPWVKWVGLLGILLALAGASTGVALTLGREAPTPTPSARPAQKKLQVKWSADPVQHERTTIRGSVIGPAGATVKVNGRSAALNEDGTFVAEVEVPFGRERVCVLRVRAEGARSFREEFRLSAPLPGWFEGLEAEGGARPLRTDLKPLAEEGHYRHTLDGSEFSWIPPGKSKMGGVSGVSKGIPPHDRNEHPVHPIELTYGFFMGIHEISRGKFERFSAEAKRTSGLAFAKTGGRDLPMQCNWHDAVAYSTWIGGRLPSEPEWALVAKGAEEIRPYPWGDEIPQRAKDRAGINHEPVPVTSFPAGAGRWGQLNMAGNVGEWTLDAYREAYPALLDQLRVDPKPLTHDLPETMPGTYAVRGGGYRHGHPDSAFRTSWRSRRGVGTTPSNNPSSSAIGFRVVLEARAPEPPKPPK